MSAPQQGRYDSIARRWLGLVERRQEHFLELCETGRWRHYYTHAEFLDEMRKVLQVRDQWAVIAGLPRSDEEELAHLENISRGASYRPPRAAAPSAGIAAPRWPD
jgi:uncharacterized repeat protein (TIGR03809 family)